MEVAVRLANVKEAINAALLRARRPAASVKLLAVSKGQSNEKIIQAIEAGQKAFGENYLQEALFKIAELKAYPIEWHYLGALQTNKTRQIAENFSWVHSVCRVKIADRLNAQRPSHLPPLNVCVQINLDRDATAAGIALNEVESFISCFSVLPRLHLRGLMLIPKPTNDFEQQKASYTKVTELFLKLNSAGYSLDTLSMGMSDDFEAAIAAGSTLLRIGSAIFGERS